MEKEDIPQVLLGDFVPSVYLPDDSSKENTDQELNNIGKVIPLSRATYVANIVTQDFKNLIWG